MSKVSHGLNCSLSILGTGPSDSSRTNSYKVLIVLVRAENASVIPKPLSVTGGVSNPCHLATEKELFRRQPNSISVPTWRASFIFRNFLNVLPITFQKSIVECASKFNSL